MARRRKTYADTQTNTLQGIPADRRNDRSLKRGYWTIKLLVLLLPMVIGLILTVTLDSWIYLVVTAALGLVAYANVYMVMEWESAVVLRFGRFKRIAGPGIFFTIPFIDFVAAFIDQRLTATTFKAERTLTSDCVPVDVDAVLFWLVWDPKSAYLEVKNYSDAVFWAAQTSLRDAIGQVSIAELSMRRNIIDEEIQNKLVKKTEDWGVTIVSVEIRDIIIPPELQDALSKEAQAERERNARITLAEVEEDISDMFVRTAKNYGHEERAIDLRAMNMLYDGVKAKGGLVLLPSTLADVFGNGPAAAPPEDKDR